MSGVVWRDAGKWLLKNVADCWSCENTAAARSECKVAPGARREQENHLREGTYEYGRRRPHAELDPEAGPLYHRTGTDPRLTAVTDALLLGRDRVVLPANHHNPAYRL